MAKKDQRSAEPPSGSNVSDDTIALHYTTISALKAKQRKLSGELSQAFSRAEADGIDKEAFQLLIKARSKDDPDRVVTMFRRFGDYAVATNAAFAQGELFGTATRAPGLSARAKQSLDEHDADLAGYGAGKAGRSRDDNPHEVGSRIAQVWMDGWLRGQKENATPNTRTTKLRDVKPDAAPELTGGSTPRRRTVKAAALEQDTGPSPPPAPDGDPDFDEPVATAQDADEAVKPIETGSTTHAGPNGGSDTPQSSEPKPRPVDVRNALVQRAKEVGVKNANRATSADLEAAIAASAH